MTQKLILVLNCGSSSLKGAVLDNDSGEVLLSCLAEKLNLPDAYITFKFNGEKHKVDLSAKPDHTGAVEALMEELKAHGLDSRIGAIGHRVVSGGELYSESILVDDEVIAGNDLVMDSDQEELPIVLVGRRFLLLFEARIEVIGAQPRSAGMIATSLRIGNAAIGLLKLPYDIPEC